MKKLVLLFGIAIFLATDMLAAPGATDSTEFYVSIKNFNLSKLWRSDSLQVMENEHYTADKLLYFATVTDKFPEPYGFIGLDYQRFYIHYLTVKKDSANPYKYVVTGKTKVKDTIRNFQGTITVVKARTSKALTTMIMPVPGNKKNEVTFRQGIIYCDIKFAEDTSKPSSGTITGRLVTKFYLDSGMHIFYDNLDNISDRYCNKTNFVKKCNWGDYRIPNSGDLDDGAGGFSPADKYLDNGWQNYRDAFSVGTASPKSIRAVNGENFRWWR